MWGCVGRDLAVVPYWGSLYLCVEFFLWWRSCVSSPPAGGGVGSYCDCSAIFLGHLRFSVMCHAAGDPSGVPHLADSGWLPSSCGGGFTCGWGVSCYSYPVPHFGFLPCASAAPLPLLPLRGSAPLPGASACLTPVCWSTPAVVLEGSVLCHLVFLPCAVLFLWACSVRCFP